MSLFIKSLLPQKTKDLIKNWVKTVRYKSLRILSYILYPFLGHRSPLRGYYNSSKNLISQNFTNGQYILINNENYIDYFNKWQSESIDENNLINSEQHFLTPETFVSVIPNGRVLFDYGVVVSPDRKLIGDVSINLGGDSSSHSAMFELYLPPVQKIQGNLAVISSTAHQRYFHWMFDVLPRFGLLQKIQIPIDTYLINCERSFQQESIEILGIPFEKVISPKVNTHIEAERLVVPSLPGYISYMTKFSCDFLRSIFLNDDSFEIGRCIYVTRKDALTRRLLNEDRVLDILEKYGFESVELTGISIIEQAKIFASAKIIVSPHGAGLTNIVFCSKNSYVIEFMPDSYTNLCFQRLSGLLTLRYYALSAKTFVNSHLGRLMNHDHYVDTEKLEFIVRKILS